MLTPLVVLSLALAAVGLLVFAALCIAIRREDRSPRLTSRPPTAGTAITRRIAGLSIRRAAPPSPGGQPQPRAALWAAPCPPDSDHERR
jgi:hypothetical protein